jgi:hypothetical protein
MVPLDAWNVGNQEVGTLIENQTAVTVVANSYRPAFQRDEIFGIGDLLRQLLITDDVVEQDQGQFTRRISQEGIDGVFTQSGKASSVGAKTVKLPGPARVGTRPAASAAATRVSKRPSATAISAMGQREPISRSGRAGWAG